MSGYDIFNLIVTLVLLGTCVYLFAKHIEPQRPSGKCDPQLQLIHRFFNESLFSLLSRMERKIEDHFETEYGENQYLLQEQFARYAKLVMDYGVYCAKVSAYPGDVYLPVIITPSESEYTREPWEIGLSEMAEPKTVFKIPHDNIAYLIDRLTDMNDYNEKLILMIKTTQQ